MPFNGGKPYHGSEAVTGGRLTGTTDTDYFYFFCPRCTNRRVMRVLDYDVRREGPTEAYPDERPRQARDFTLCSKFTVDTASLPTS